MTRELFGESEFPVDVAAVDFANEVGGLGSNTYRFGLSRGRAIQRLRDLADKLERGDYLLQGVTFSQEAKLDDYTMSTLLFRYAEKKAVPAQENNLADPLADGERRIQVEPLE
jgi:hypothetical protein